MSKHQASVPAAVSDYFRSQGLSTHDYKDHPVIAQTFTPGLGWKRYPIRKRVSLSACRGLKRQGVTAVALTTHGRTADFQIAEVTR